jgi:hypothetical protein
MILERWQTFSKREQLLHTGAEFERARICEEESNSDGRALALKRALELIHLSLQDSKWRDERAMIETLEKEVKRFQDYDSHGVALLYQVI